MRIYDAISMQADPDAIFEAAADVERWPEFSTTAVCESSRARATSIPWRWLHGVAPFR